MPLSVPITAFSLRISALALAALFAALPAALHAQAPPDFSSGTDIKRFSDFKEATAHAKARDQFIFVACIKAGDADSEKLSAILASTALYLNPDRVVLYEYRVPDDARIETFRSHFKVTEPGLPIVLVTDPSGVPLAHRAGLLAENDYYTFVEQHADPLALSLPTKEKLKRNIAAVLKDAKNERGKYRTEMRTWTLVTGETFRGAVLESTGSQVVFETEGREYKTVPVLHLSKADVTFLQNALKENPPAS